MSEGSYMHTHLVTCTHLHACTFVHYTFVHTHSHAHMYTLPPLPTPQPTCIHTSTHPHLYGWTLICTCSHTHAHMSKRVHYYSHNTHMHYFGNRIKPTYEFFFTVAQAESSHRQSVTKSLGNLIAPISLLFSLTSLNLSLFFMIYPICMIYPM